MKDAVTRLLSRKFIFGLVLLCMGFYLTAVGKVDVQQFFVFAAAVGATYVIGNIATDLANKP